MTEHSSERTSESDIEADEAQVEPSRDDAHVGRVAADDALDDETSGAEARAAGPARNDPVE